MELSKSQKRLAREIIEKGLQAEFARGLSAADKILSGWKNQSSGNKEAYHALFHHIWEFDKHIAARYDRITGSRYLFIISEQLMMA